MRRWLASSLAAVLAVLSPGLGGYEAAAQAYRASAGAAAAGSVRLYVPASAPLFRPAPGLGASLAAPAAAAAGYAFAGPSAALAAAAVPAAVAAAPAAAVPAAPAAAAASAALAATVPAPSAPKDAPENEAAEGRRVFDQAAARAPDAGDGAPPVAGAPSAGTPALAKPGAAATSKGKSRIPGSLWGLFWGHDIATVLGINFHILSQPFLVQDALGMGTATMGFVRNIHMGAMAIVNFLPIGYLIDKTDYRVVAVTTAAVRALLMAAIPMLFMAGGLHFTVLAAIVAFNPLFQSTMIVAEGAANKTILGKDEKLNKDATATFSKWDALAGMAMPLVAGWAVGALVTGFGLGGYALAYGVYAGLLLVSIPIYWFTVKDPRFPGKLGPVQAAVQGATFLGALLASMVHPFTALARWAYASFFPKTRSSFPEGFGARLAWAGREALVALAGLVLLPLAALRALRTLPGALKAARAGAGSKGLAGLADLLDRYKPMEGLAYILRNRTLRILTSVMALEVLLADALPFVILPNFITEAVGKAPLGLPGLFASAGGLMGLLFSVEYLGRFLPSMRLEGDKGDKVIEKVGHGAFYRRAAVSSLFYWALLVPAFLTTGMFWVNLAIVAGVMFGVQYFNTPVGIVLAPVKRAEMDDDKVARIESAVFMVDVAFESLGALALGLLLDFAGLKAALIATALFLSLTGILQYKVPSWIFPDGNRPAKK